MTTIDVTQFGAKPDPAGKFDSLPGIKAAIAAAAKAGTPSTPAPLVFPGPDPYYVSDTVYYNAAGDSVVVQGDGSPQGRARVKFMPNRPLPTQRDAAGNLQGRHLFVVDNPAKAVLRDIDFDLNGAQQQAGFVGDNLRVQHFDIVDAARVTAYNPRGLTTSSTPDLPETFGIQWLRGNVALEDQVSVLALDGAPTATGIVSHWVKQTTAKNGVSAFVRGQGFGTYASGVYRRITSWGHGNGNNFNFEAGGVAGQYVVLGDPLDTALACISSGGVRGLLCNGNGGVGVASVRTYGFKSQGDRTAFAMTGVLPGVFQHYDPDVSDPVLNMVNVLCGTQNQAALNLMQFIRARLHAASTVPVVAPKTLKIPAGWQLARY